MKIYNVINIPKGFNPIGEGGDTRAAYESGYTAGFNEGYTSGHTEGFNEGYESGTTDGFENGYSSGYTDGQSQEVDFHTLTVVFSSTNIEGLVGEARATVTVEGQTPITKVYTGQNLTFNIIPGTSYTLSFGSVSDYTTPASITGNTYWGGAETKVASYVYNQPQPEVSGHYLTFYCVSDGTLQFRKPGQYDAPEDFGIEYRLNGGEWQSSSTSARTTELAQMSVGDIMEIKGKSSAYSYTYIMNASNIYYSNFNGTGSFNIYGDITSLYLWQPVSYAYKYHGLFSKCNIVDASNLVLSTATISDNCFDYLFGDCSSLVSAPELPATRLYPGCYNRMFKGCTNLAQAPALPATNLATSCYAKMFSACTSLTSAPALQATELENNCYDSMFAGCTNLSAAPALPATSLKVECYSYMFADCTSLTATPVLTASILPMGCYQGMFAGNTSLTNIRVNLSASSISSYACQSMFSDCTSLITAPELPATNIAGECYRNMFLGCTSLTTGPAILPATTLAGGCYQLMFYGCTNLEIAPVLPATTLKNECYKRLFEGCSSLNHIECMAENVDVNTNYTTGWLDGVSSTGTFVKSANATTWPEGGNGIPYNWTVTDRA